LNVEVASKQSMICCNKESLLGDGPMKAKGVDTVLPATDELLWIDKRMN